jgi:DNA topoisomerase-6 subunit A
MPAKQTSARSTTRAHQRKQGIATMAKKSGTQEATISSSIKKRDAKTMAAIETFAADVTKRAFANKEPRLDIPLRTKSNTIWNKKQGILQMGDASAERQLFNLGQAKQFMQTCLHAKTISDLIEQGKTLSLRGAFYRGLHTVSGTKAEKTFGDQDESDGILEDLEVSLGALREELHVFAKKKGTMIGNITITDSGDEIDCRRMGSGGYAIPSIVEPDVIQFKKCDAKFVLHVEKDTVWGRFNEDKFWQKHNCILTEGGGQPSRGVRRLLQRLNNELGLPIYCLLDCDPWGHYIFSVIKQGSISLAFESNRLAIPDAKFIGVRSKDYDQCKLSDDVKITLTDTDIKRAKEIADYPWFTDHKGWQKEIAGMLNNGFKMEVESLITKDISYVTEEYVPARLKAKDWLE